VYRLLDMDTSSGPSLLPDQVSTKPGEVQKSIPKRMLLDSATLEFQKCFDRHVANTVGLDFMPGDHRRGKEIVQRGGRV